MTSKEIERLLIDFGEATESIKSIYIFGSFLTSDRPNDLDIAVEVLPGPGDENPLATFMFESQKWQALLAPKISLPLDLQLFNGEKTPTIAAALRKNSVKVYEKRPSDEGQGLQSGGRD